MRRLISPLDPQLDYHLRSDELRLRERDLDLRELELEQSRAMLSMIASTRAAAAQVVARAPSTPAVPSVPPLLCDEFELRQQLGMSARRCHDLLARGMPHLRDPRPLPGAPDYHHKRFDAAAVRAWMSAHGLDATDPAPPPRRAAPKEPPTPATENTTMKDKRQEMIRALVPHFGSYTAAQAWLDRECPMEASSSTPASTAMPRAPHADALDKAMGEYEMRAAHPYPGALTFGARVKPN